MAAPVAAIHPARVHAPARLCRSRTLARWMAGSSPAMTEVLKCAFNWCACTWGIASVRRFADQPRHFGQRGLLGGLECFIDPRATYRRPNEVAVNFLSVFASEPEMAIRAAEYD